MRHRYRSADGQCKGDVASEDVQPAQRSTRGRSNATSGKPNQRAERLDPASPHDVDQAVAHRHGRFVQSGVRVSSTTMGRVLKTLGAWRGRGKPLGPYPWGKARKNRRTALIDRLIESLPPDQAAAR